MFPNMMGNLLKMVIKKVQEKNTNDVEVKTADSSVFDNVMERFQKKQENAASNHNPVPAPVDDFCDDLCNELDVVQKENEADPHVETADKSVFEDMKRELEELKKQVAQQQSQATSEVPSSAPAAPAPSASNQMMAMTNSNGGSLAMRANPDMGAAINSIRVPDQSLLRVIEYSENSINLDGQQSRFVLVEYNDQQGWILESYLNFN